MNDSVLVATDLDGTLLGDIQALGRFSRWWADRPPDLRLAYASRRLFASVVESIEQYGLPRPDAIVGGVGTEIRLAPQDVNLDAWQARWWPYWNASEIRRVLADHDGLAPQADGFQSEFKLSYSLPHATPAALQAIRKKLAENSQRADLIYSSQRDLDVVPVGVNKGTAIAFLAGAWQTAKSRVIVCGDAGDDLQMFLHGFRGVVVANAHEELTKYAGAGAYVSDMPFADGVVDGLRHWLERPAVPRPAPVG